MPFTVEDGTGVAGANSYISVAGANAYCTLNAKDAWDNLDDTGKQAALLQATAWIEGQYRGTWVGKLKSTTQGLSWPRERAFDEDRRELTGVPQKIKDAVCELALATIEDDLAPAQDRGGRIISQTVGPISTTYESGAPAGRTFPMIRMLLTGLSKRSGGSIPLVRC